MAKVGTQSGVTLQQELDWITEHDETAGPLADYIAASRHMAVYGTWPDGSPPELPDLAGLSPDKVQWLLAQSNPVSWSLAQVQAEIAADSTPRREAESEPVRAVASDHPHAELWQRFKANPTDFKVKQELSLKYVRWVWKLAYHFIRLYDSRHSADDLFSEGFEALYRAMDRWGLDGKAAFLSFSRFSVLRAMSSYGIANRPNFEHKAKFNRARDRESHRLGRRANDFDVASSLGISEHRLNRRLSRVRTTEPELASPLSVHVKGTASTPYENAANAELCQMLKGGLDQLQPIHRNALYERHVDGRTFRDSAAEHEVCTQAIQFRCNRAEQLLPALMFSRCRNRAG